MGGVSGSWGGPLAELSALTRDAGEGIGPCGAGVVQVRGLARVLQVRGLGGTVACVLGSTVACVLCGRAGG